MTVLISFLVFMAMFLAIGLAAATKATGDRTDYYLAGSKVPPWLVGLSAVATNNSGFMFIGVIGFTYAAGLDAIWLMVGWIAGDFLASLWVHRQLRQATGRTHEASFAAILARWDGTDFALYRRVAAIVIVLFLATYAAAQIAAGGKALQAMFGWHPDAGALAVTAMVIAYCFAGGIRASIWTDAAQATVMIAAMTLLLVVGTVSLGGPAAAWSEIAAIPNYLDWFPEELLLPGGFGALLFVIGWLFAGISVIGQPHIMVRFMALDSETHIGQARAWYYSYYILFYLLATGVGMLSRLLLPELGELDPELALPTIAQELLPPVLIGLVLAGIFAATMSTADSLVLSCSAAITHDLVPQRLEQPALIKGATVAVTLLALVLALFGDDSVFVLVILAWSFLASAFAPLLMVYAAGRHVTEAQALAMMALGIAAAWGWRVLGWQDLVYDGMAGILAGLLTYWVWDRLTPQPREALAR